MGETVMVVVVVVVGVVENLFFIDKLHKDTVHLEPKTLVSNPIIKDTVPKLINSSE